MEDIVIVLRFFACSLYQTTGTFLIPLLWEGVTIFPFQSLSGGHLLPESFACLSLPTDDVDAVFASEVPLFLQRRLEVLRALRQALQHVDPRLQEAEVHLPTQTQTGDVAQ